MLFDKKASEIPQFVILLAIAVMLGGVAVYGIMNSASTQGTAVSTWISSLAVPAAHP
jgi:hypothetical protein